MQVDLTAIHQLRQTGQHEAARDALLELARQHPADATVQYQTARIHDYLGLEREAIPFYLAALQHGLTGDDLRGAYLGLGSTYRTLGMYTESKAILLEGLTCFPQAQEMTAFLAMTRYNLGEHHEAVASLLRLLMETTSDADLKSFERPILLYAENLDQMW
jgi:tetratricopeptide (TPR) repeat protein